MLTRGDIAGLALPDRKNVLAAVIAVAFADNDFHDNEIAIVLALSQGETKDDMNAARDLARTLKTPQAYAGLGHSCAEALTMDARERLISTLLAIAWADGFAGTEENGVISAFAYGLGIPGPKMNALADAAADGNLFGSIARGRVDAVRRLLEAGASVADRDPKQWTPLHVAVATGQESIVDLLLERGADPNVRHGQGSAPLLLTCNKPYEVIAEKLIRAGARVDDLSQMGLGPLHVASMMGQPAVVSVLLRHGASVELLDSNGNTALHHAASENQAEVIALLLQAGARAGFTTSKGVTALHLAAAGGYTSCARLLLDHGASVDAKNVEGGTPLFMAAVRDRRDVSDLLVARGANPDATTNEGRSPRNVVGLGIPVKLRTLAIASPPAPPVPAGREGARAIAKQDLQIAMWTNATGGPDLILIAGKDHRGRPVWMSRGPHSNPRERLIAVTDTTGRRWLPMFTSEAAAEAFRRAHAIGWAEGGMGIAAAGMFSFVKELVPLDQLPLDGAVLDPYGPTPRTLSLEDLDSVRRFA